MEDYAAIKKSCFPRIFNDMWKWSDIMLNENSKTQAVYTVTFQFWLKKLHMHRRKKKTVKNISNFNSGYLSVKRWWVIFFLIYCIFQISSNEHVWHLLSDKSYFFSLLKRTHNSWKEGTITKDGYESSMNLSGRQKLRTSWDNRKAPS